MLVDHYLADKRERGRYKVFDDGGWKPQLGGRVEGVKEYAVNDAAREAYEKGRSALTAHEAKVHFEQSIRLDPNRAAPYNALGLNALHAGDRTEAERLFKKALEVEPDHWAAKYNLERLRGVR